MGQLRITHEGCGGAPGSRPAANCGIDEGSTARLRAGPARAGHRNLRLPPIASHSGAAAPVSSTENQKAQIAASLAGAEGFEAPYRHWLLKGLFDEDAAAALHALPFPAPDLGGVSGARELHNDTRRYFDQNNIRSFDVCRHIAEAFQDPETVGRFQAATGADLTGCCLRIEFAQDVGGFWLKPHTDLGVKKLTLLCYLADGDRQGELGTDIYADPDTWAKRTPFETGSALLFVPSDRTWHGFAPRDFSGVRRSVIVNYVSREWRAREQLAYPDEPVRAASIRRTA